MHPSPLHNKRVLILFGSLDMGGAERQGLILARYLKEHEGACVTVWGLGGGHGVVADICDSRHIPWSVVRLHWGLRRRLPHLLRLALRLRAEKPDILLSYTKVPNLAAALLWRICGVRLCVWNQADAGLLLEPTLLHRSAIGQSRHFIANADIGRRYLVDTFGIRPEDVQLIRNGITVPAPAQSRSEWRNRLKLNDGQVLVTMVANLSRYKDHATLLKAWRRVLEQRQGEDTPLLALAGRPDDTAEALKLQAEQLGVAGQVCFLGAVNDVAGLLNASDICVHSSVSEGIPNAVLEAMFSGLPVAGSDIPGLREAVGEAGCGYLAPPADASALADVLLRLIDDADLRATLGRAMHNRAEELFGEERMCRETAEYLVDSIKGAA
ncbi:MAG: glycosyltransferase family 4 protein [Desulfuromonadaceae bacterium]|nr:glycosyltransferase family 4 protein [Desulfuromonadaceae bacterium]MDD2847529.1 glycosyltransferase family 4 protein [Desulfuromonadaceae bacterium]MDD4131358.1 glycosyltransferase family 4 protein [Desulfuromonadaceae bacterium]